MAETILIIDDEPDALKLFGYAFHRQGYTVLAARSGQEGLDLIAKEPPDLLVLDLMMPGMDGYEVCRRIRENPETKRLPIIVLTAKVDTSDKVAGFEVGADDYVTKPVPLPELLARVRALLVRASYRALPTTGAKTKVIGFLGAKGGVGTSTLAVSSSMVLTREGYSVILAELHPYGGAAVSMMRLVSGADLSTLLAQEKSQLTPKAIRGALVSHYSGVGVLQAPPVSDKAVPMLSADKAEAVVNGLQGAADYLVLDLGTGLTAGTEAALRLCQHTILVTEQCPLSLSLAKATLVSLSGLGLTGNRVDVVVNSRSRAAITMSKPEMEAILGQPLFAFITPSPELCFQAVREGTPMVLMHPDNTSVQAIVAMTQALIQE